MKNADVEACTCWRRYRICIVPLMSVLAIVGLGWIAGRWLFPQQEARPPRSIMILDIAEAAIPEGVMLRRNAGTDPRDSTAIIGRALKYSALVKWSAAMFFNLVLFVCALWIACHVLLPALREGMRGRCPLRGRGWRWLLAVVPAILAITYVVADWQSEQAPFMGISRVLLKQTVGSLLLADIVARWDSIGICVIVMIALAAGATLNTLGCGVGRRYFDPVVDVEEGVVQSAEADPSEEEKKRREEAKASRDLTLKREIRMLMRQTHRLRLLLYIGAIVLVFSLFETTSLFHLATVFTEPGTTGKPAAPGSLAAGVDAIVSSLTMFRGFLYVLFLVALYVPAAALLRARSVAVARIAVADDAETPSMKWLEEHGLTVAPAELLKPLLAIASPLLAVPFGELVGRL